MDSFAMSWRALGGALGTYLRRRGVHVDEVDDLVQETGVRLLHAWPRLDTTSSVEPLARTIALNLWRDHLRSRASSDVRVAQVPEYADVSAGVERVVIARDELAHVVHAISRLPSADRALLSAATARALGAGHEAPTSPSERMRLMRCRRGLTSVRRSHRQAGT